MNVSFVIFQYENDHKKPGLLNVNGQVDRTNGIAETGRERTWVSSGRRVRRVSYARNKTENS